MTEQSLRVLLIEDDDKDARAIEQLLRDRLDTPKIDRASTVGDATRLLEDNDYRLIVLEQYVGANCGLKLVQNFRAAGVEVPVLMLSNVDDREFHASALRSGVTDLVPKGRIDGPCLKRALIRALAHNHHATPMNIDEGHFRELFEQSDRPTALLDRKGCIRHVNARFAEYLNANGDELIGRPIDSVDPLRVTGKTAIADLVRAAADGEIRRFMVAVGHQQQPRLLEGRVAPLRGIDGSVHKLVLDLRDGAGPFRQETAPLRNAELLGMFIRHVPAAVAMFDDELRYLCASRRWMRNFGLEGRNVIGKVIYDVYPIIREQPHWLDALDRTLAGEVCGDERERYEDDEGHEQWVSWEMRPWHTEAGEVGGLILFAELITEEVRTETQLDELQLTQRALGRERSLLRAIIDSMSELVFYQDLDGRYQGCNQRYLDFFRIEEDRLLDHNDDDLRDAGITLPEVNRETTREVLRSGKPRRIVDQVIGKDQVYHLETILTPILDEDDNPCGVLGIARDETDWYQLVGKLREHEERLDLALRASNIAVFTYHYNRDRLDWDDRHFKLPGDPASATLDEFLDLIHEADRTPAREAFEQARETGSLDIEYGLPRPTGRIRRYVTQGRLLKGTDRLIGTTLDITERSRAASDVHRAKERLDVALAATALGIMEWVPATGGGGRYRWDDRVYRILGLPPDADAGLRTFGRLIHPDDLHGFRTDFADSLRKTGPYRLLGRIRRPDGEIRVVELLGRMEIDNGRLTRQIGTIADITERRRLESDRERDRERLELALKASGLGTWMWRFDESVINFGPRQCRLLGLSPTVNALEAEEVTEILHPDDARLVIEQFKHCRRELEDLNTTFRIRRRNDGEERVLECTGRIVTDEGASPAVLVGVTRDVTDLVRYQQDLERARDAAEQATRAKSRFLANMSHEIRTPINAILGFSQLLRRSPGLSDDQRDHVETVLRSGDHLLKLVNDVLELSKIEAGMVSLNSNDFELRPLLNDLVRMFSLRIHNSDVELRCESHHIDRVLHGDESKIRQILINLLNNAIKFTPDGEIVLHAEARELDANDVELILSVSDTGIGIGPGDLPHIFGEFRQADSAGLAAEGTGLGLTICKTFAQMMDGSIEVESELGEGSRFTVRLRLAKAVGLGPEQEEGAVVASLHARHGKPKVLIVDDKADHRKLLVELFSTVGFETQEASGAREAWSGVSQWDPDLVVLDVHMPRLNGCQLISRIRSRPEDRPIPILAMSASVNKETETTAYRAGANAYLRKPFRENDLFQIVGSLGDWEFVYAGATAVDPEHDRKTTEPLSGEIALIPQQTSALMTRAAISADMDALLELIAGIKEDHPTAAHYLERLAIKMDYDAIIHLLGDEEE